MADDADKAALEQQREIDRGMTVRRPEGPAATGECLNCGEPVAAGRRWCNAECRDEEQS